MSKLYELTGQYLELQKLADSDEIPMEALQDTFEALEGEYQDKAIAVMQVAQNYNSVADAIDLEIQRLQALKNAAKAKNDQLREYLRSNMEATGIKKIEHPLFKITLAAGRDIVEITDVESIPDDYIKVEVKESPDKKKILEALKEGANIPGVALMKSKSSLRIK